MPECGIEAYVAEGVWVADECDLFVDAHEWVECPEGVLGDKSDSSVDVYACGFDAGGVGEEASDEGCKGGFSGTGRPHDGDALPARDAQVLDGEHALGAVADRDVIEDNHGLKIAGE